MPIVTIFGLPSEQPLSDKEFVSLECDIKRTLVAMPELGLAWPSEVTVVTSMAGVWLHRRDVRVLVAQIDVNVGVQWPLRTTQTFQTIARRVLDEMIGWAHTQSSPFVGNQIKPLIEVMARPFPMDAQTPAKVSGRRRDHAHNAARIDAPIYEVVTGGYASSRA